MATTNRTLTPTPVDISLTAETSYLIQIFGPACFIVDAASVSDAEALTPHVYRQEEKFIWTIPATGSGSTYVWGDGVLVITDEA